MAKPRESSDFQVVFWHRLATARGKRSQEEIAEILGIHQSKYSKYEIRSFMPHDLIHRFVRLCGTSIDALFAPPTPAEVKAARAWDTARPKKTRRKKRLAA